MIYYNCPKEKDRKRGKNKMEKLIGILLGIGIVVFVMAIEFGILTLAVLAICKIIGIAFAWKWVVLLWIVMVLLSWCFKSNSDK